MNCETFVQQPFVHKQSERVIGSTSVSVNNEVPKVPQYTPQQVVTFGGD
jgi:hypothetical protein